MRFILLAFALAACHAAPAPEQPDATTTPDGGYTHDLGLEGAPFSLDDATCTTMSDRIACNDIVYSQVGGAELHLDLIAPLAARTQKVPVLVYFHPGGWSVGNYHQLSQFQLQNYLARGYAAITVEYRLTLNPDKTVSGIVFPQNLQDAKTAIRWIRVKASGFIDTDRIVPYGVSAGAHLASLIGTTPNVAAFDGRGDPSVPTTVKAVVGISTVIDFHLFVPLNPPLDGSCPSQPPGQDPQQGVSWLLGGPLTDSQYDSTLTSLSMLTYMNASAPPMFLTAGTCDQTVPYHGAEEVAARGLPQYQVLIVPNAFHGTTLDPPSSQSALDAFIGAQLQ